jgi:hypothetical protein
LHAGHGLCSAFLAAFFVFVFFVGLVCSCFGDLLSEDAVYLKKQAIFYTLWDLQALNSLTEDRQRGAVPIIGYMHALDGIPGGTLPGRRSYIKVCSLNQQMSPRA